MKITKEELEEAKRKREKEIDDFVKSLKSGGTKESRVLKFFKNIPKTYQYRWLKAYKGELGRAECAKLHCIECAGWSLTEAKRCVADLCPMFNHRPKLSE